MTPEEKREIEVHISPRNNELNKLAYTIVQDDKKEPSSTSSDNRTCYAAPPIST